MRTRPLLAVAALGAFGAVAAAQEDHRTGAGAAGLDDARIQKLVGALGVDDLGLQSRLCALLTQIGAPAVPHLIRALPPPDAERITTAHRNAVRVLGRIGEPAADAAAPRLLGLIPHEDAAFERAVILTLGELAPHARRSAGPIRSAMIDVVDADPIAAAAGAARKLFLTVTPTQPSAIRTYSRTLLAADAPSADVVAALRHDNPYVRELAIELLERRKAATEDVIDGLCGSIRGPHPKSVTLLQEDVNDDIAEVQVDFDRRLRHRAAQALLAVAPDDPRSVPAHVLLLERPGPKTRRRSALALGRMGAAADAAVPTLVRLLDEDIVEVRREVATALGMIGVATPDVLAALRRAEKSPDRQLSKRAAAALRRLAGRDGG